jgi:hypothetical protein
MGGGFSFGLSPRYWMRHRGYRRLQLDLNYKY